MKIRKNIICIILLLFIGNVLYSASISGTVLFKNNKPAKNIKILCISPFDTFVTYTDSNGRYNFILSKRINTLYFLYVSLIDGQKDKFGEQRVRNSDHTIDLRLRINSIDELN